MNMSFGFVVLYKLLNLFKVEEAFVLAVEKNLVVRDIRYSGYIVTNLSDIEFLRSVLKNWSHYTKDEIETQLDDADEMGYLKDVFLRTEGLLVESKYDFDNETYLIKIGRGKWVADNMSFEDLKKFVEVCKLV